MRTKILSCHIYTHTHMLFITVGDRLISPSPGLANTLTDRAKHTNRPTHGTETTRAGSSRRVHNRANGIRALPIELMEFTLQYQPFYYRPNHISQDGRPETNITHLTS
jgi:hypothetical protein